MKNIAVTFFVCDAVFALGRYILCDKSYLLLFSFLKLGTFHEIYKKRESFYMNTSSCFSHNKKKIGSDTASMQDGY